MQPGEAGISALRAKRSIIVCRGAQEIARKVKNAGLEQNIPGQRTIYA